MGQPGVGPGRAARPDLVNIFSMSWAAQPGPAHRIFRRLVAARPGSSKFNCSRPGPMTFAARPKRHVLYMGQPTISVGQPMCHFVLKRCTLMFLVFLLFIKQFRKMFSFQNENISRIKRKIRVSFGFSSQNPEPEELLGFSFWKSTSGLKPE